jgi:hypothetical protein
MTEEQIFELASKHLYFESSWGGTVWSGKPEDLLKFSREIRKESIEEVITSLTDVPNPEANREAINRIVGGLL